MLNPHSFRQYDIRGVVGTDITPALAEGIGRAFATLVRRRSGSGERLRIALGRDNRLTSNELADAVSRGIRGAGLDVLDVGTVPTPALSFAAAYWETDASLQVTGSHNPAEYNGFKMAIGGRSLWGDAVQEIRRLIETEDYESGDGEVDTRDVLPIYVETLAGKFTVERPVKVVVDCGNGSGSLVAVELLEALGGNVEVIPLFCESDGTFPNHHPDPVVDENLVDLIEAVQKEGADLGIAFDGDADRIGAVDEKGNIVRGDIILLLYGLDMLERHGPGQPLVFDVKCSPDAPRGLRGGGWTADHGEDRPLPHQGADEGRGGARLRRALGSRDVRGGLLRFRRRPLRRRPPGLHRLPHRPVALRAHRGLPRVCLLPRDPLPGHRGDEIRDRGTGGGALPEGPRGDRRGRGPGPLRRRLGLIRASNTEPVLVARYEAKSGKRLDEIRETMEGWLAGEGVRQ
jgi:phosphomannomutase / phosphoglucomutase